MNFRLAVVGHLSSVEELKEIVTHTFSNVDAYGIELSSDEGTEAASEKLTKLLPKLDGVLYTRYDPYKLMVSRVDHSGVAVRYADIDANSFIHSLLYACHTFGADICRVSVDTLSRETVMQAYDSLDIGKDAASPVIIGVDTNAEHFVSSAAQAHRQSYRNGLCGVCLTNIRNVRDTLEGEGIPCVLMVPSRDSYLYEIRRLMLSRRLERQADSTVAILRIRAKRGGDYYLQRKTAVQSILDQSRLCEIVVMFAQRVNGAFLRVGERDFVIMCGYKELAACTEQFSRLDLMVQVFVSTPYRLSIGIGTGHSMQAALSNADLGVERANAEGGSRAYLVHAPDHVVGPIQTNEILQTDRTVFDQRLTQAAQDCALSLNTVFKIDAFVRQKNNSNFITSELAEELHISLRTAARIVEKLEYNGYILEIGRSTIHGRGRPTRVFKLMW